MKFTDIPLPEVYKESADFRFFITWFSWCLSKVQNDIDQLTDLLDPERCPANLLWMLADTMGFKYDERFPVAYNRLILLYFMSMIYNRGSRTGMTIAAETNLAQFNIQDYAEENPEYADRLVDTSIPVNSVYVTEHTDEGYIDLVYYSENPPTDACIEYVRPLGMYCFANAGVSVSPRTKISVDARLADSNNVNLALGPTHIGHYRRSDYASLQKVVNNEGQPDLEKRKNVYYRNSKYEGTTTTMVKAGYRSLTSLQLCNNEHVVKSLLPSQKDPEYSIFSMGYGPENVETTYPDNYLKIKDKDPFNLRYDEAAEAELGIAVTTIDPERTTDIMNPRPAVNPPMMQIGDSMSLSPMNNFYVMMDENGKPYIKDVT